MKLYATTTSERASKGQGGNEYLNIVITVGKDGKVLAKLDVQHFNANGDFYELYMGDELLAQFSEPIKSQTKCETVLTASDGSSGSCPNKAIKDDHCSLHQTKSQKAKNGVKCAVCKKDCPNGISCCIPL